MKIKKIGALLMALTLGLASCSDDNVSSEENGIGNGDPSYASFSIRTANTGTTRADDANADSGEMTINTVSVYIFSNGVLEVMATPEINSDVTVPVAVTTGEKIVYAVTTENVDFTVTERATLLRDFEKELFSSLEENIADDQDFVMIGSTRTTVVKCTEAEAEANPVKVSVDRAAAKLQVKFNSEDVEVYPTINADFADCFFGPAQSAKQMYVNLKEGMYTPLGTKTANNGTYSGLTAVPSTLPDNFLTAAVASYDPAFSANRYMGENIAEEPTTGKVTFALISLKATPKKVYGDKRLPSDGTFYVAARNAANSATWIYASDEDYNIVYFASDTDAKKFITDNKLGSEYKSYKFDKGVAYYRVNLRNTNDDEASLSAKYRVVRNNYYRIDIKSIRNLGSPTGPGVIPTDPDTPIEQDSFIACEIEVKPWTMHEQDGILQ